jgi:phosphohistidine phosphatase
MNELYVVRHGIAEARGTPETPDSERQLTVKGRKQSRQVGRGLRRLGIEPDRILTSPLPRALETARIIADALRMADRLETANALAAERSGEEVRDWVLGRGEDRLMIVGHNPALSDLVGLLVAGVAEPLVCELKKGGVAMLETRGGGGFLLGWLAPPQHLRRTRG